MSWLTENVVLQILILIGVLLGALRFFGIWILKNIDSQIYTKADWLRERKELKDEHDVEIRILREEHVAHLDERVASIVKYYEEKIQVLITSHKVELESMRSTINYLSSELEHWKGHAAEREIRIKQEVKDELKEEQ